MRPTHGRQPPAQTPRLRWQQISAPGGAGAGRRYRTDRRRGHHCLHQPGRAGSAQNWRPRHGHQRRLECIVTAYGSLFEGSLGSPPPCGPPCAAATRGDLQAIYPFTDSLVAATPYIFAGLAVAVGFRCGLFNIGVEGQLYIGAICSVWVGLCHHRPASHHPHSAGAPGRGGRRRGLGPFCRAF